MKTKFFVAIAATCLLATVALAQTGFNGKWATDPPAAGAGGRGGGQTRLDVKVEGTKMTGTMFEGGADLVVADGAITGKQAKWTTTRQLNGADFKVTWTADMTDDNTISITREFPAGFGGGGGGGGGGGRGGGGAGGLAPVIMHRAN